MPSRPARSRPGRPRGLTVSTSSWYGARSAAPIHHVVGLEDVGAVAAFLVGDWAKSLTGSTTYVDAGYHIIG